MTPLGLIERGACLTHRLSRLVFLALAKRQRLTRGEERRFVLCALRFGLLTIGGDAFAVGLAFVGLELGALPTRHRVALALLRDGHLAANLLNLLALAGDEAKQLGALCFGGRTVAMRRVACLFGSADGFLRLWRRFPQLLHAGVEPLQLIMPRNHLALGERDLDRETARHQLGVAFRALALARERAHLALHLGNEVVEALQIDRRFFEAPFRGATAIAVEAH